MPRQGDGASGKTFYDVAKQNVLHHHLSINSSVGGNCVSIWICCHQKCCGNIMSHTGDRQVEDDLWIHGTTSTCVNLGRLVRENELCSFSLDNQVCVI
jgi:hypothetical protein